MIKILFVCHGNICRSPMAEFVLRDLAAKRGLSEQVAAASAATSTEEIGNGVHPGTQQKLAEHGISSAGKRAVQLRREDYDCYDMLIGMDVANIRNMKRICGGDPAGKIYRLMDFTAQPCDVGDPWYSGDFEATWRCVLAGCEGILERVAEG